MAFREQNPNRCVSSQDNIPFEESRAKLVSQPVWEIPWASKAELAVSSRALIMHLKEFG